MASILIRISIPWVFACNYRPTFWWGYETITALLLTILPTQTNSVSCDFSSTLVCLISIWYRLWSFMIYTMNQNLFYCWCWVQITQSVNCTFNGEKISLHYQRWQAIKKIRSWLPWFIVLWIFFYRSLCTILCIRLSFVWLLMSILINLCYIRHASFIDV